MTSASFRRVPQQGEAGERLKRRHLSLNENAHPFNSTSTSMAKVMAKWQDKATELAALASEVSDP